MSSHSNLLGDIESDRSSREAELNLIERLHSSASSDFDKEKLRRMFVVLAYAHLEGFCKFILTAYVSEINALQIKCADATPEIAAAALSGVFGALRDPNRKHPVFAKDFPDDTKLHLSARERIFVSDYTTIYQASVSIPDTIVDTKSNVDTAVLKKLLFCLGLDYQKIEEHRNSINHLLGVRNAIAHGDRLKVPTEEDVRSYITTIREIMSFLQNEVYEALKAERFLRPISAE